ncbi:hypothetical protein HZA97_02705 [Candidatus Woesearchaeota archaeon]|nr:hypothetical protein [Candidatus Woesearchaeota archaeon]
MQEEITQTTKSTLDKQGRITRQVSRVELKPKEPILISKIKNFFGKLFPIFTIPDINVSQSEGNEAEGPHCYSPAVTSGSEFCSNHQACAQDVCGPVANCVDNDTSITITLENGNTETFNHAQSGARYFCREDANGQKSIQYSLPCSSPYHQYDGMINYQCSPQIGSYCARGSCGDIARCEQNGNTATITLTNGNSQSYRNYYCVGNELSRISQCLNPFEQQGSYCGTNKFCADRVCGNITTCEQVDSNTVRLTLETGQQETYQGSYACVRSDGQSLVKRRSDCTSPFGQEAGLCGQRFRNNSYQNQFCAGAVCDFLTSCVQTDADSVTITTASGFSQSYNGYVCDEARGIISLADSQFSCSSLGMEQERNSDGAFIDSTLCPRGQACVGTHCGDIANCVDNDNSITITLANGNTQTINHPETGARYFCREDANGQKSIQYSLPCSSPYHQYDGMINYQCSPQIGSYCARGNCGTIASCVDGNNNATITLTTGESQTYRGYRCSSDENGNLGVVRR